MSHCSYCKSKNHDIRGCQQDKELERLFELKTCPDFFKMSTHILKKLASLKDVKTSLPHFQLATKLSKIHLDIHKTEKIYDETSCPICMEDFTKRNISGTECGHKFCTTCLMRHLRKKNNCPCCRSVILKEEENSHELSGENDRIPVWNYDTSFSMYHYPTTPDTPPLEPLDSPPMTIEELETSINLDDMDISEIQELDSYEHNVSSEWEQTLLESINVTDSEFPQSENSNRNINVSLENLFIHEANIENVTLRPHQRQLVRNTQVNEEMIHDDDDDDEMEVGF